MYPHDINWENLNASKISRIFRIILSYILIIIFLLSYFIIVTAISVFQNTFQRKYNLLTDCSNVDYENNYNLIYNEYKNLNQNEKEKIYTYCFCSNNSKTEISYNEISFDPCIDYKKYKYLKKALVYFLTFILLIIDLPVDIIVDKIISIQNLESKSAQDNLKIIISIFTLIFTNVISVVLINSKIYIKYISKYFGEYEDITPQWVNEMSDNMLSIFYAATFKVIIYMIISCFKCCKFNQNLFLFKIYKNPIIHFYEYFNLYAPQKDYTQYLVDIIFYLFIAEILIISPLYSFCASLILFIYIFFLLFEKKEINSCTLIQNKAYFRITFSLITMCLIFYICLEIWWYSSEYFFIDVNENIYDEFFGSNKSLIDKFIIGNASISEKIKLKLLFKRNIFFIIELIIIIVSEALRLFIQKPKKKQKQYNVFLKMDDFSTFKYYEYYKLIKTKLDIIYSKHDSIKELYEFIDYKLDEYKRKILRNDIGNNNDDLISKKKLINSYNLVFSNPDFTYSPFLLEEYNISFVSKFILSPSLADCLQEKKK